MDLNETVVHEELEQRDEWDRVDEAGWESFPASDPPSYIAGAGRRPALAREPRRTAPERSGEDDARRIEKGR